jgi:hypothetical protein
VNFSALQQWFLGLGAQYGVNPLVFGSIYVGAIPFFLASIAWLVRRRKAGLSITLPLMSAGFFFVSAYLYLALVGRNIPVWIWLFLGALIAYGGWSTVRDVRRKIASGDDEAAA